MLRGDALLAAARHLGNLCVVLVLVIALDVAVSGARRGVDGALALLETRRGDLGGVCRRIKKLAYIFFRFLFQVCFLDD